MNKANECTCPSGDGSLVHPCPAHPAVEQAGGDRWDALQSIMEWTAAKNIPDDRKLCLIRNAARAALAQPSPVRSSLLINGYQLRAALDFIAPDGTAEQLKSEACIEWRQQDADFLEAGLYAFCAEYPEEGGVLLDEEPTTAQPSPLQSEQAEAERPEVVARVVHSNPVVLGQCGPLNANDELMTVAQHAASVARWAEMFNRVEQERDAALARVAELAQALRHLLHNIKASGKRIDLGLAKECAEDALARIDSTVAAQAQHSGPEEFSFEYRHPNGESHTVTVSRDQVINEMPDFLFEALCSKFCNCEPAGETNVVECCCDEYAEEFKLLAAAPAQAQHSVPEGWMLVPVEPLLNMMSDKDHDTRITAERQLLSILAAAPGKEVGHE